MNEILIQFQDGRFDPDTMDQIHAFCRRMDASALVTEEYEPEDIQVRIHTRMDVDSFWYLFKKEFHNNTSLKNYAAVVHMMEEKEDFEMLYHFEEQSSWTNNPMH